MKKYNIKDIYILTITFKPVHSDKIWEKSLNSQMGIDRPILPKIYKKNMILIKLDLKIRDFIVKRDIVDF